MSDDTNNIIVYPMNRKPMNMKETRDNEVITIATEMVEVILMNEVEPEIALSALLTVITSICDERPETFGPMCQAIEVDFVQELMTKFQEEGILYDE